MRLSGLVSDAEQRVVETSAGTDAAAGSRYPDVMAEVQRLQRGGSSKTSALLILLVSIGLFVGIGGRSLVAGDGWQSLLLLVPILFFHEAGHWLAMRYFGYRNLKMFFIPFFGAAVTGQHYNVPGWKKAVVSLMGPLPGIGLGAVLGVAGLIIHQPLMLKAAMLTLLLNGFNLLPFLPLDGGWVLEAILFSRHAVLDLIFRIAAVLCLVALWIAGHDVVFGVLAFMMLLSIPSSNKLARITRDLRRTNLEPISADDQTIPTATADAIVARVREAFPAVMPPKVAAQHTLRIFETLNARPPGLLGSLGIGLVHAAGMAAAVVFASMVAFAQHQ